MIAAFAPAGRERRERIQAMMRAVRADSGIRPAKHVMLVAGLLLLGLIQDDPRVLLFAPLSFVLDVAGAALPGAVAARRSPSAWAFAGLQAAHLLRAGLFTGFAVLAARDGGYVCLIAGLMLLAAQVMHSIAVHAESPDYCWIDVALVGVGLQGVVLVGSGWATESETVFLHVSLMLLTVFYACAMLQTRRTSDLLRQTSRRLARAQRSTVVGELATGMAHDFNNLLTVMKGNLQLLREVPEAERPALLREIETAAARGGQLVERLSSTGRDDGGGAEAIPLAPILERVERMAASTLPANVRLRLDVRDAPCNVAADPARLELAVLNLVVNARDALPGGGTILVRAVADAKPGRLRLSVVDDGEGMTPDVLARATEAYETTKAAGRGTGLGLSMVSNFVEETNGRLTIESRSGVGTRVEMILPTEPAIAGAIAAA